MIAMATWAAFGGQWIGHRPMTPVEHCEVLRASEMLRPAILQHPLGEGRAQHLASDGTTTATARWRVERSPGEAVLVLERDLDSTAAAAVQVIALTTSEQPGGGTRWWFQCGGLTPDGCGARAGTLHRPPGARRLACRSCHALTYACRLRPWRDRSLWHVVAGRLHTSLSAVRRIQRPPRAPGWVA